LEENDAQGHAKEFRFSYNFSAVVVVGGGGWVQIPPTTHTRE